jgi:hypothetical protein
VLLSLNVLLNLTLRLSTLVLVLDPRSKQLAFIKRNIILFYNNSPQLVIVIVSCGCSCNSGTIYLVQHLKTFANLSKDDIFAIDLVKLRVLISKCYEKLRCIGVFPYVRLDS